MEERRTRKMIWIIILFLVITGITVAFALLSQQLQINGTARAEAGRWEIKFEDFKMASKTDTVITGDPAPDITGDTTIGDFRVILKKPGDIISYTFDVHNNGSIDAKIGTLTKAAIPTFRGLAEDDADKENDEAIVRANFSYTLKYTDTSEDVAEDDLLEGGEIRNMTLTLAYDGTALPTEDVEISDLGITILYIQQ